MANSRLIFPPETETYLLEALTEFGIDINDRKKHLSDRTACYKNHPILCKFINPAIIDIIGPPPSEIVDSTLWHFIQYHFDGAFQLFNKPTVIVPIPLYKNHATIIKDGNIDYTFIFINEYDILMAEGLSSNVCSTIYSTAKYITDFECDITYESYQAIKDIFYRNQENTSAEEKRLIFDMITKSMETMLRAAKLVDEGGAKEACNISDNNLSYLQNILACDNLIDSDDLEHKFKTLYLNSYPISYSPDIPPKEIMHLLQYAEHFLVGYIFRIIGHEIVHRDSSHLTDEPKLSLTDNIDTDDVFDAIIELEADLWISRAWHNFINHSPLDESSPYPYLGMLWANLTDYTYAITTLTCENGECVTPYEEWICRLLLRDHALIPDDLISLYPTELERMEASMFNPISMACIMLPHDLVCDLAKITSLTAASCMGNEFYILKNIQKNTIPNYFGCKTCNKTNPFIPFNIIKDRLERYKSLDDIEKSNLSHLFENRQSPLDHFPKFIEQLGSKGTIKNLDKMIKKYV